MSRKARKPEIWIRWFIRRDMPEVLAIERESFEFPWFEEDFVRFLRQHNAIGMVAERGERIAGYMCYQLNKCHIELVNFAVAPADRRQGVGRAMIDRLMLKLSSQRRRRITLHVRETNLGAQQFFAACGFRAVAVLRKLYHDTDEDAYVFVRRYQPSADKVRRNVG